MTLFKTHPSLCQDKSTRIQERGCPQDMSDISCILQLKKQYERCKNISSLFFVPAKLLHQRSHMFSGRASDRKTLKTKLAVDDEEDSKNSNWQDRKLTSRTDGHMRTEGNLPFLQRWKREDGLHTADKFGIKYEDEILQKLLGKKL